MKASDDQVVLHTSFDEAECLRRLRDALDAERRKSIFSAEVNGVVGAQEFQLAFNETYYQYTMPHFRGRLFQETHGTRVEGQFMVSRFGTAIVRSLGVMFIGAGVFFLVVFGRTGALGVPLVWVFILSLTLFGILFLGILRRLAKRHRKKLSEFLENALMAQIQPGP